MAELGQLRLQNDMTKGTDFLILEVLPCTRSSHYACQGCFLCMSHTPFPAAVGAEGRALASRELGWEGGRHPGEGAPWELISLLLPGGGVFPGLWGHSPQSQKRHGYPGMGGALKSHPHLQLFIVCHTCA